MTIMEALNWAQQQFRDTAYEKTLGEANPMFDAQVLLAHCLEKPTSYLFGHFDDPVPEPIIETFQRLVHRRTRHEPIAYLTGEKAFYGKSFKVNPAVLIPRPETEALIDLALERRTDNTTYLDVGTGSGAIAVSVAGETFQPVIATELSLDALGVAKHNADAHDVAHQVSFLQGNLLDPYFNTGVSLGENDHVMVLANLPYIPNSHWNWLDPDVNHYEPKHALIAGVDGLEAYDELLDQLARNRDRLPSQTEIACEIDPTQCKSFPALVAHHFPEAKTRILNDLSGRPRIAHTMI